MKILFFGDSITDAHRDREKPHHLYGLGTGFVNGVASRLAGEAPDKYEIINRGISGNRVVDLYARIKVDAWNESPDLISILIGVNDVWHEIFGNNGVELDRFERVYRMMIEDTRRALPDVKLILCEPFVLDGAATHEALDAFREVYQYAAVVKQLAAEYGIPFVALQAPLSEAAERYGAERILADGVHPALAGAAIIAEEWLKTFQAMK